MMANEVNSSVILTVVGLEGVPPPNQNTNYSVVALSNNQPLYGANHVGKATGWNDSFAINLKDVEYEDLVLSVFVDDHEFGRANLSLLDLSKNYSSSHNESTVYELLSNGYSVGRVNANIHKLLKEEIVGGLVPPTISLRSDHVPVSLGQIRGIEKVHSQHLNFFSCMDAKDLDWEPYPTKFKSRIRQHYDVTQSILELQKISRESGVHGNY